MSHVWFRPTSFKSCKKGIGMKCEAKIINGKDNTKGNSAHQVSKAMDRKQEVF